MKHVAIFLVFLLMATAVAAELMSEADIPLRCTSLQITYDVNADGSFVETERWTRTILKESALEGGKHASVTFSTSVAQGEILEAYTVKKTGQRIDVPKSSYQVSISDGYEKATPLFSDETSIEVVFPDFAVGDSIVFASRVTNREGMFPNQFSVFHVFSRFIAFDDVSIEINAPASMKLNTQAFFMAEQKPTVRDGRQTLRWSYKNMTPEKWTPASSGIPTVGDDPSLFVSTFKSYQEIAEAYGVRATAKAAVTNRVKELAASIAADKPEPKSQARAIYDWVAKNISYGGNCIGIGAVVPRDLDVVLDNKMGDCKDHATLLQALLAARNIESEQALINARGLYQLPEVPVVAAVNHVINYIPSLNLFVDPTSSMTPFGMLPATLGEKPVLPVTHYRAGLKTPSTAHYGHEQIMSTILRINADGSATGKTDLKLKGYPAANARALMRKVPREQEDFVAKRLIEAQGAHGTATLQKDDPTELLDSYNFSISYNLEDFMMTGAATGISIRPIVQSLLPIEAIQKEAYDPASSKPQLCGGGTSIEEYALEFPEALKILATPKDFAVANDMIEYKASYGKEGNTLTVRRELRDKTGQNVCSPEYIAEYKKTMLALAKDIKAQVLLGE